MKCYELIRFARARNLLALLVALSLIMVGCSTEFNLKLDPRLPLSPAVKQIPLHIAVYYSPEFVDFREKIQLTACGPSGRRDRIGVFFTFPIGTASRDLFDQIVASMFTTVTRTSGPTQASDASSFHGLLEPRIESFDWGTLCSPDYFSTGRYYARVCYVINLYSSDGNLVSSMRFEGFGKEKPKPCFVVGGCKNSFGAEQAMHDAMAKFMIEFSEQSEVKQWLSTQERVPGDP